MRPEGRWIDYRGSLTVVGYGITEGHVTAEALACIKQAKKVFILADLLDWVQKLRPDAENLERIRDPERDRREGYEDWVEHILTDVRRGLDKLGEQLERNWEEAEQAYLDLAEQQQARREEFRALALEYQRNWQEFSEKAIRYCAGRAGSAAQRQARTER
jgi:hypothetical protein